MYTCLTGLLPLIVLDGVANDFSASNIFDYAKLPVQPTQSPSYAAVTPARYEREYSIGNPSLKNR